MSTSRSKAGNVVGAIPLFSPTSGMLDYGLVIQPRFPWPGIGPMLAEMGWRIAPTPLKLPLLKRSERKVPLWVISCMVLARLKALLDSLSRRFELVNENRSAPRGTVRWSQYATRYLATGQFLSVPCTFPDLRDDRLLVGAIRYSLEKQRSALSRSENMAVSFISSLHSVTSFCAEFSIIRHSCRHPARWPLGCKGPCDLSTFGRACKQSNGRLTIAVWRALAIWKGFLGGCQWNNSLKRGSRLSSVRWPGSLERSFWLGGEGETVQPIDWEPPYLGSQKALVPDIWLNWGSTTLIVDAKYKRHWDELEDNAWGSVEEMIREQHRSDLFQVLAYANLARTARVIVCLAYPCTPETWERMIRRNRVLHKAEINAGARSIAVWLTAVPMATAVDKICGPLLTEVRSAAA